MILSPVGPPLARYAVHLDREVASDLTFACRRRRLAVSVRLRGVSFALHREAGLCAACFGQHGEHGDFDVIDVGSDCQNWFSRSADHVLVVAA